MNAYARPGRRPGDAPPVWRSRRENELFAGRDDELERIWDGLTRHRRVVLVPEGDQSDIGETELAGEYQHRFKLRYDVSWWVDCSTTAAVPGQIGELYERARTELPGPPPGAADAGPESTAGWLVIFAGVGSPDEVAEFLPDGEAHVIIIADRAVGAWRDRTMPIGPLRRRESVMLLTSAAPMVDPATAAQLGELVGHRPALLAEIAGYLIREAVVSPELCRRLLEMAASRPTPAVRDAAGGDQSSRAQAMRGSGTPAGAASGAAAGAGAAVMVAGEVRDPVGRNAARAPSIPVINKHGWPPREVDELVAALMRVEYIADLAGFDHWFDELTRILGRTIALTSPVVAVRLTTLVSEAVGQPDPGMLDALLQALDLVAPRDDRSVVDFRRLVTELQSHWSGAGSALPGMSSPVPAYQLPSWPPLLSGVPSSPPPSHGPSGTPTYYFFTSHAHRDDRDRVAIFHRELELELRRKVRRRIRPTGFFDADRLGGGEHWPTSLRDAVRTAPVLVALWCDDYFESDWCGREFGVFQERIRRATKPGGNPPSGIIPVPWLRRDAEVPEAARELHIAHMELGRQYDNLPVLDLMRHPAAFAEYVSLLAYRVMDVARDQLPPLDAEVTELVRSPFHHQP
ncbi:MULTISPECIES: toll/interleukin-1 receptor domain-containing protein [Frankia]|uniref:toll/interleukin-1 receptor domain-containing protein n=1 Tax=Frankia TaxID=1854 RepID=UPI000460DE69|nr:MULTISPECIES: toll/interleukin-1 receptor domain-containing protein [Frankia]KDA42785.1 hypothetical protein BMG523Draft_02335 [Frankia sp. BMG5.23]ORT97816.1 hypothetical protein UK99_04090 [Frankia casuarinae]